MSVIEFKSVPEYYAVESADIKRNTERFTDDWDNKRWLEFFAATRVRIKNTRTDETFERIIQHKCTFENIAIISW